MSVGGVAQDMFVSTSTLQKEIPHGEVQWKPKGSPAPSGAFGDPQGIGKFRSLPT